MLDTINISHFRDNVNRGKEGGDKYVWKIWIFAKKKNITPYKVSKETKISTATLSDWKNGRSKPKADKLKILANYFDVPIEYFLE